MAQPPNGVSVVVDLVEDFTKRIGQLTTQKVMVGIPATAASRSGDPINNATLGYMLHYGTSKMPPRPWLIPPIARMKDEAAAMLRQAAEFTMQKRPDLAENILNDLGSKAVSNVKVNIVSGGEPPFEKLAQSTIDRKGKGPHTILVDTAQLLNSITYVIRNK